MSASQSKAISAVVLFSRVVLAFAVFSMLATFPAQSFSQTAGPVFFTSGSLPAAAISVTITPASVEVPIGMQQQFTATVTGISNTGVTWSVNGEVGGNATVGTISASGLYTAPAKLPGSYHALVRATSVVDAAQSASARVLILCGPVPPTDALFTLSVDESNGYTYQVNNYSPDFKGTEPKPAGSFTVPNTIEGYHSYPLALAVDLTGATYVGSSAYVSREVGDISQISTYCPGATGAAQPIRSFIPANGVGAHIAVDPVGNLYTAIPGTFYFPPTQEIDEYPAGSGSAAATPPTVSPLRTISGPHTEIENPVGLAVDPQNSEVFVGDQAQILVFNSDQSGDAKPVRTISDTAAGLLDPYSVAVDASGNVYVLYADYLPQTPAVASPYGALAVAVYAPGAATPSRVISGPATQIGTYFNTSPPSSYDTVLAVDPAGNIYVASTDTGSAFGSTEIAIFNAQANGNVAPTRTIDVTTLIGGGQTSALTLAVDSEGYVYFAGPIPSQGTQGLYVFSPTGSLTRYIPSSQSGLGDVGSLTIDARHNDNLVVQSYAYTNNNGLTSGKTALFVYPQAGGTGTPIKEIDDSKVVESAIGVSSGIVINSSGTVFLPEGNGTGTLPEVEEVSLNDNSGKSVGSFADPHTVYDLHPAIAIDSAGRIYIPSRNLNVVDVYAAGASGNDVSPVATYSDYRASTFDNAGLYIDAAGTLYSTSQYTNSVSIYPKGASKPSRTIVGPNTLLYEPFSLGVDNDGSIYVVDAFGVNVFAPDAEGDVAPIRRGIKTYPYGYYYIQDIAIGPGYTGAP